MSTYKVTFENNRAISSAKIESIMFDPLKIEQVNDREEIKWMTIFAGNKEKSIKRANEIARQMIDLLNTH